MNLSTAAGLGALVLWSTTFALARSLSERVGPLTAGASVYLIGGLVCLLRLLAKPSSASGRLKQLPRTYLVGCGGLFIFYTAAIYGAVGWAKSREQLLEIALVNYLWPALTVLGSLLLLTKRASVWLAPGTLLGITGVFLVLTQSSSVSWAALTDHLQTNPAAYGLALAAAISWALYSNLARRWSGPETGGAVDLFIPATGIVLLGLRLLATESTHWSARAALEASALAAFTTVAYILWDLSMRRGNLILVVACSYLTPLLSTLVSGIYLGASLNAQLTLGCLLLMCGSFVSFCSVSD